MTHDIVDNSRAAFDVMNVITKIQVGEKSAQVSACGDAYCYEFADRFSADSVNASTWCD